MKKSSPFALGDQFLLLSITLNGEKNVNPILHEGVVQYSTERCKKACNDGKTPGPVFSTLVISF